MVRLWGGGWRLRFGQGWPDSHSHWCTGNKTALPSHSRQVVPLFVPGGHSRPERVIGELSRSSVPGGDYNIGGYKTSGPPWLVMGEVDMMSLILPSLGIMTYPSAHQGANIWRERKDLSRPCRKLVALVGAGMRPLRSACILTMVG